MNPTAKRIVAITASLALLVALAPTATLAQEPTKKKAIKTGTAAGIGALLGFALAGDPLMGAAGGAALGAAGGMIANKVTEGKRERKAAEAERSEEYEAQLAARERRIADLERELQEAEQARADAQAAIIEAVGPDVWEGYKALRGCQHERAYLLAKVGMASADPYHQLGALWLETMVAVDENDHQEAASYFQTLAEVDTEIDTVQQARIAADEAVADMNAERKELGIACN